METEVKNDPVVAVAGVTGAVGAEFIATMNKRALRVGKLKALASARSAGKTIDFRGKRIVVEELDEASFEGVDIALFSAGGGIARKFAPIAVGAGAVVIDNSSAFRMDPNVPLVIPEINANRIGDHKGIIAVPN
jgi:aspartate-semialdehyde dehydrogenase